MLRTKQTVAARHPHHLPKGASPGLAAFRRKVKRSYQRRQRRMHRRTCRTMLRALRRTA
ncbi:MAG: hypothetical protein Fur005_42980 [Roseiflexaceae bacterium]